MSCDAHVLLCHVTAVLCNGCAALLACVYQGVSGGIHARSEAKAEMALGRSLGPMLVPKSREEAVAWAVRD